MSYQRLAGPPAFDLMQSGTSPRMWGGLPGPVLPVGPIGPMGPAASLFPTNFKPGDVVMVSGNFTGLSQGQVRVLLTGAPPMAPMLQGPFTGSFIVPDGTQTGACQIEVNGQIVFGTQCVVTAPEGATFLGQKVRPREPRWGRTWKNYGDRGRLGDSDAAAVSTLGSLILAGLAVLWILRNG